MPTLQIAVRREYFHDIKGGTKPFEFRLRNEYWRKRLVGRDYGSLVVTLGYPNKTDHYSSIFWQCAGRRVCN